MSDNNIFLGRQPILNRKQELVGFELLFRTPSGNTAANITDGMLASITVINHTFSELGVGSVLHKKLGFINVNEEMLLSNLIEVLPQQQIVLELVETVKVTPEILERCHNLKTQGFQLALDDYTGDRSQLDPLLPLLNFVKVDVMHINPNALHEEVTRLKKTSVKLLAEKVEDHAQMKQCMDLNFDYFQGYYFAKPVIIKGQRINSDELTLLKLLGLIAMDADFSEIESVFKQNPNLTFKLLRMINSVAFTTLQKINSVRGAIMLLGRRQLQRWIQLLVFARQGAMDGADNPLLQLAATRGKFMELLARRSLKPSSDIEDAAFMTGILSLLDALMGVPLPEILMQINVEEEIKNALLQRQGVLGDLLQLVQEIEQSEIELVQKHLQRFPTLSFDILNSIQAESLRWANSIGN